MECVVKVMFEKRLRSGSNGVVFRRDSDVLIGAVLGVLVGIYNEE